MSKYYWTIERVSDEQSAVNRGHMSDPETGRVLISVHLLTDGIYHVQDETPRQGIRIAMYAGFENAQQFAEEIANEGLLLSTAKVARM